MEGGWRKSTEDQWKSASERDRRALELGRAQKQLATTAQLANAGFSAGAIQYRADIGRLFPLHSGVYSLSPPPFTLDQQLLAATLAAGEGSAVSNHAAGWLLGLLGRFPDFIDVISLRGTGRGRRGLRVHRRSLAAVDVTHCRGIPSTNATRTIVDLASTLDVNALESALLLASSRGLINDQRLTQLAIAHHGRPGAPKLRAVLGMGTPRVRSGVEVRYLQICRTAGLQEPLVNQEIVVGNRTFEVDFHWPDLRIVVEVDGYAFHGGRSRANEDRDREQCLTIGGWSVHRFTRDQIVDDPAQVARRTVAIIRQAEFSGGKPLGVSGNPPLNP